MPVHVSGVAGEALELALEQAHNDVVASVGSRSTGNPSAVADQHHSWVNFDSLLVITDDAAWMSPVVVAYIEACLQLRPRKPCLYWSDPATLRNRPGQVLQPSEEWAPSSVFAELTELVVLQPRVTAARQRCALAQASHLRLGGGGGCALFALPESLLEVIGEQVSRATEAATLRAWRAGRPLGRKAGAAAAAASGGARAGIAQK